MMRSWIYDQRQGDDAWVGAEPNPLFNPFQHNQSGDYMLHVQHDAAGHINSTGGDQHTPYSAKAVAPGADPSAHFLSPPFYAAFVVL